MPAGIGDNAGFSGDAQRTKARVLLVSRAIGASVLDKDAAADGETNDRAAFQSAFADLDDKATLFLPSGDYFLDGSTSSLRTLSISGKSNFKIHGHGAKLLSNVPANVVLEIKNCSNFTIEGLDISHLDASTRTNAGHGIYIENCTDFTVRDCTIHETCGAGIALNDCLHFTIVGNSSSNTNADGIHCTNGCAFGSILGNRLLGNGDDGISIVSYLTNATACSDIDIGDNTVQNGQARGISVIGGNRINIADNVVNATHSAGIMAVQETGTGWESYGCSYIKIQNNLIVDAGTYDGPQSLPGTYYAIRVGIVNASYPIEGVDISFNTIIGGKYGQIRIQGLSSAADIKKVSITNNQLWGPHGVNADSTTYGQIVADYCTDLKVLNNNGDKAWTDFISLGTNIAGVLQVWGNWGTLPNQGNFPNAYGIRVQPNINTIRSGMNGCTPDGTKTALVSGSSGYAQTTGRQIAMGANGSLDMPQITTNGTTNSLIVKAGDIRIANSFRIVWAGGDTNPVADAIVATIDIGSGSPEGVVSAGPGLYLRTDGGANTTLYVKESGTGNTGWVAK